MGAISTLSAWATPSGCSTPLGITEFPSAGGLKGEINHSSDRCRHAQAEKPCVQLPPLAPVEGLGLFQADAAEADAVARPELAELVQVGSDHLGNLGIAADRLAVHPQDDALAVARHLHRPRADRLGHQLPARRL